MIPARRTFMAAVVAFCLLAAPACATGKSKKPAGGSDTDQVRTAAGAQVTPAQLRADMMGFADRFAAVTIQGLRTLETDLGTTQVRQEGLSYRVFTVSAVQELAVAPNVGIGLLDMISLVTLTRMVWEDHYAKVYGESTQPMITALRSMEKDVWALGAKVLTPGQQEDLRGLIQEWRRANPDQYLVSHLRLADISRTEGAVALTEEGRASGLFGIGEALTAVEETREVLERTIWFVTRLQTVATWQAELVYTRLLSSPETSEILTKFDEMLTLLPTLPADIAERSLVVSHQLLGEISVEREAAVNQILQGFAQERLATLAAISSEEGPRAALADARATIEATSDLVARLDGLMIRLEPLLVPKPGPAPAGPPARPFDINEYRAAIAEATTTIERLDGLVGSLERMLASPAVSEASALFRGAFRWGVALAALFLAGLFAVLLAYRWITIRWLAMPAAGAAGK
jgi:hypothetical protein